jgi:hypothetical protein
MTNAIYKLVGGVVTAKNKDGDILGKGLLVCNDAARDSYEIRTGPNGEHIGFHGYDASRVSGNDIFFKPFA